MKIALLGGGYVADFYGKTLPNYPELTLAGAFDTEAARAKSFCELYGGQPYASFEALLADKSVEMVLNLTNPRAHLETTSRCLEAGKHVYSEKPLAMKVEEAAQLLALAKQNGVRLACAPCSLLSETAQTLWKALREGVIGKVRLIYANFDDGMIAPKMSPWNWVNERGVPWPAQDEFEVGCTYEHAGYVLTWLAAFFGPVRRITSFASCQIPDKGIAVGTMAPDFTTGCLEYDDGVVARVTCGLVAPHDKSLTIVGDDGVLTVRDVRHDARPVLLTRTPETGWRARVTDRANRVQRKLDRWFPSLPGTGKHWHWTRQLPLVRPPHGRFVGPGKDVDFCRGPAELAAAIAGNRPCRLSPELGLHMVELIESLQFPARRGPAHTLTTTFDPIDPSA